MSHLTPLQMNFCAELIKDPSNVTAAYRKAVGYDVKGAKQSAHRLIKHPKLIEWVEHQRTVLEQKISYSLEQCHADHEQAKRMAVTATEYLNVVESLMRLHSLLTVTKQVNSVKRGFSVEDLREMNDEQLIALIGHERLKTIKHERI